tara:strand:+ start:290 stop:679 length:390 start_codon:yes stop_codon:yes gene_type:complete
MATKRKRKRPTSKPKKVLYSTGRTDKLEKLRQMRRSKKFWEKFDSPKEKAKRDKEFARMWAEAQYERVLRSDGYLSKPTKATRKFKIDKRSSSSVALPPRDSKEHEKAFEKKPRGYKYKREAPWWKKSI